MAVRLLAQAVCHLEKTHLEMEADLEILGLKQSVCASWKVARPCDLDGVSHPVSAIGLYDDCEFLLIAVHLCREHAGPLWLSSFCVADHVMPFHLERLTGLDVVQSGDLACLNHLESAVDHAHRRRSLALAVFVIGRYSTWRSLACGRGLMCFETPSASYLLGSHSGSPRFVNDNRAPRWCGGSLGICR